MKKILFLVVMFLISLFSVNAQTVNAVSTATNSVKSGDTFEVTINISKCDLSCFAQYQQQIPNGFTASEISSMSDNANFYFENGKVLYQWYKLPVNRNDIVLKYKISVDANTVPGVYELPGYFSYQINNRLGQVDTKLSVEVKK
ncbi:MAG: hypothetical protein MJ211_09380 [Bacteroidales bacterium]|nr:hypothetical protein [Bacteroidales bacterium]